MIHEMKLQSIYFDKIKNGQKIYEIRLNDEKRQLLNKGDIIIFKKENDLNQNLQTIIKDLIYFNSFNDMVSTLSPKQIGFENNSKDEIIDIYHSFYSTDDEIKYGVVAIKVEVIL